MKQIPDTSNSIITLVVTLTVLLVFLSPMVVADFGGNVVGDRGNTGVAGGEVELPYVNGQVVVKFSPDATPKDLSHPSLVASGTSYLGYSGVYLISIDPSADPEEVSRELEQQEQVHYAHPNYTTVQIHAVQGSYPFPDENLQGEYQEQPAAGMLNLTGTHTWSTGAGVRVAIIDAGVEMSHEVFEGGIVSGYDYVDLDQDASEEPGGHAYGHGTFVAGVVNLMAPDAEITSYRVISANGFGDGFSLAQAIEQAVVDNCDVINVSLVLTERHLAVRDAINYASSQGVVIVAAAGNDGQAAADYPAAEEHVIGVTAVNLDTSLTDFANFGTGVDVCAPGLDIYSAFHSGGYAWWSGTSFSTAFVSGVAALAKAADVAATPDWINSVIRATGRDIDHINPGHAGLLGGGMVVPEQAVASVINPPTAEVSPDTVRIEYNLAVTYVAMPSAFADLTSTNAPAAYTWEIMGFESLLAFPVDDSLTDARIQIFPSGETVPVGVYYSTIVFYVEGVLDPVELVVELEIVDLAPTSWVEPDTVFLNYVPFIGQYPEGEVVLSSSNAPSAFTLYGVGNPNDFFLWFEHVQGFTDDTLRFMAYGGPINQFGLHYNTVQCWVDDVELHAEFVVCVQTGVAPNSFWTNPSEIRFADHIGTQDIKSRLMQLLSDEAGLDYSATVNAPSTEFISLSPVSGTTPDEMTVSADFSALSSAGWYSSTIEFEVDAPFNKSREVVLHLYDTTGWDEYAWVDNPSGSNYLWMQEGTNARTRGNLNIRSSNEQAWYAVEIVGEPRFIQSHQQEVTTGRTTSFEVDGQGLASGVYENSLLYHVAGCSNSPHEYPITLIVESGPDSLDVAWVTTNSAGPFEQMEATEIVQLGGIGLHANHPFSYTTEVLGGGQFINYVESGGTANSVIDFTVDGSLLQPGVYLDTIRITVPGALNSPIDVPVLLRVNSWSGDGLAATNLELVELSFQSGFDTSHVVEIEITSDNAPAAFTIGLTQDNDLLYLIDSVGQTNAVVSVGVQVDASTPVGVYTDTLEFWVLGVQNRPLQVVFTMTVQGSGGATALVVPQHLVFYDPDGSLSPIFRNVYLYSSGGSTVYSAGVSNPGESFIVLQDTVGVTNLDSIPIGVDASRLSEYGTYVDTVFLDVLGADNTPQVVVSFQFGDTSAVSELSNWPNPFNPQTTISFNLGGATHTTLTIFNVLGQEVRTLIDEPLAAGRHSILWDGTSKSGQQVASGVYFYRLRTNSEVRTKKLTLVR